MIPALELVQLVKRFGSLAAAIEMRLMTAAGRPGGPTE